MTDRRNDEHYQSSRCGHHRSSRCSSRRILWRGAGAGAGRFARIFIASTEGYLHPGPGPTIEDVAEHWASIKDESGYYVPADLGPWAAAFMPGAQR